MKENNSDSAVTEDKVDHRGRKYLSRLWVVFHNACFMMPDVMEGVGGTSY